ncbi:MAG: hypothetical protein WB586_09175 [Chthoniobacterales bacterium]
MKRIYAESGDVEIATDAKFTNSHVLEGAAVKSTRRSAAHSSLTLIGVAMVRNTFPST